MITYVGVYYLFLRWFVLTKTYYLYYIENELYKNIMYFILYLYYMNTYL